MKRIKITDDKYISDIDPCFIIAEIGQNHNGDINIAKKLIDVAVDSGADAVKFCKRDLNTELTISAYNKPYDNPNSFGITYGEHREFLELNENEYAILKDYADSKGIIFFASVCGKKSVELLDRLGCPLFKIASRDLTNLPLIKHIASKYKPIILSTGMSSLEEIYDAVNLISTFHENIILMHCTSEYPTPYKDVNLNVMGSLKGIFPNCLIGFSGHTIGVITPVIASCLGAVAVEKHITLARCMKGTDHVGALEPDGLKRVCRDIRNLELSFGDDEIKILPNELINRKKLGRSIVSVDNFQKGTILEERMLIMKSPGNGLTAKHINSFIGKRLKHDIEMDHIFTKEDIE